MTTPGVSEQVRRPPGHLVVPICIALVGAILYLRLALFPARFVPLADALPLLICLWTRSRTMLWSMALALTAGAMIKVFGILPAHVRVEDAPYEWTHAVMMLLNIWLVAGVVQALIGARDKLEQDNVLLAQSNAELEASNEELAAREEEITQQNEELQAQTEELEQQSEELQQQAEENERQSAELHQVNEELSRRERALQVLLDSSRWLQSDLTQHEVISRICQAALDMMEHEAAAAAIVEREENHLVVRGHYGLGPKGTANDRWEYERSFASLVIEEGHTAYLAEATLRPDLELTQPAEGAAFRSVLACPLKVGKRIIGAVELYSREPRQWSEKNFRVIEWLASQIALVMDVLNLEMQLDQRRREAEEASLRKTRFLAAVSHDVRTPVNAINLMAELISHSARSGAKVVELAEMARDLRSSATLLVELVSDVLDLARFDSATFDLQEEMFALWSVVQAGVNQLSPLAQEQGLELKVELPDQPVWLKTDRMKLARVLGNLIGNAIKFTERGVVQVKCVRLETGAVQVQIIDTGIGIAEEHLADIFDEFFQLKNPARDRSRGTGLGLAICKRLVEAMSCDIGVQSASGRGSTFSVTIPPTLIVEAPADASDALAPAVSPPEGRLAGLRILLVEDHEITRRTTARLLAREGATIIQADTGRAALQILAHEYPQVMLLDLMLPDMDGSEVLKRLRHKRPPALKCILGVSGDVTESRFEQMRELGAHGLIAKPVDMIALVTTIQTVLELRKPVPPHVQVFPQAANSLRPSQTDQP